MCNRFTMPDVFLSWWRAVPKQAMHPVFRQIADYPAAGDLLAMIIYWYCPPNSQDEGTRAHMHLDEGETVPWVVIRSKTWRAETGTSEKRYRRARRVLQDLGLIEQANRHFQYRPAIWLRLKVDTFMQLWQEALAEALMSEISRNHYFYTPIGLPPHLDPTLGAGDKDEDEALWEKAPVYVAQMGVNGHDVRLQLEDRVRLQLEDRVRLQSEDRVRLHIDPVFRSCIYDPVLKTKPTNQPGRLVCPKDQKRSKTILTELGPWKNPSLVEKLAAEYPFERVRLVCVRALDQGTDPVGWAYAALKGDYDLGTLRPSELLSDFCQNHLTDDEATLVASLRALQTPDPLTPPVPLPPPAPQASEAEIQWKQVARLVATELAGELSIMAKASVLRDHNDDVWTVQVDSQRTADLFNARLKPKFEKELSACLHAPASICFVAPEADDEVDFAGDEENP